MAYRGGREGEEITCTQSVAHEWGKVGCKVVGCWCDCWTAVTAVYG